MNSFQNVLWSLISATKKKYCSLRIRSGECNYIQQGCLYVHEMPDLETLLQIGFRETPKWWLSLGDELARTTSYKERKR